MGKHWVVMGVSASGKSVLARAWAEASGRRLLDGDDFHDGEALARMTAVQALTESQRAPWLNRLVDALRQSPEPCVLAASLLKRAHRQLLREALPGLRFAHLQLSLDLARQRCAARRQHFFPAALVESQFAALEDTAGEPDVMPLDAALPIGALLQQLRRLGDSP
ncbi:gluconokinase [Inhella sp.]|uniref:gluconokinase n=1 Tax=Inhella sp. TaxID=1921806 RepID=UPI0035AEC37B